MSSYIMHSNVMENATTVTESDTDFPFANAINYSTALQARFTPSDAIAIVDLGVSTYFDTLAIAKHNIFSSSGGTGRIIVSTSDSASGPWVTVATMTPTDDNVTLQIFNPATDRYVRFQVGTPASRGTNMFIGNISIGTRLPISDGQYVGFVQPEFATKYKLVSNITRGGEIAGIIRQSKPVRVDIKAKHKTKAWFDMYWDDLNEGISRNPFYFQWEENAKAAYCWATDIKPPTWTTYNRLEFSITAEGFV